MSLNELKLEKFRIYLVRAGVIDGLTRAFTKLYERPYKPDDAIRYVRKYICKACPDDEQYNIMKTDLETANKMVDSIDCEMEKLKSQIKKTPDEIAEILEKHFKRLTEDEENKDSLLRKYLTREILDDLIHEFTNPPIEASLLDCVISGMEHHDSSCGVYAASPECYETFDKLFDPIIKDYHGQMGNTNEELQPDMDWGFLDEIENLDRDRKYILSARIRIARNLRDFPFFPKLTEKDYCEVLAKVKEVTETLDDEHRGEFFELKDLKDETIDEMHARHMGFKRVDEYVETAGCFRFWPHGRAIFRNAEETFFIWVNEEDHLRIISMAQSGALGDIYYRLVKGLAKLENNLHFQRSKRYGFLTACPTNLGTALRASVHIKLPLLSNYGDKLNRMVDDLDLQIRGTGGEHTEIVDGVMDISNRRRLGCTEFELVKDLRDGIAALIEAEERLENGDFSQNEDSHEDSCEKL